MVELVKFKTCENLVLYVTMDATKVQHCQYLVKNLHTYMRMHSTVDYTLSISFIKVVESIEITQKVV